MAVAPSVYAVYGVVVSPPLDRGALDTALEAQAPACGSTDAESVHIQFFSVGDSEHLILGAAYEELEPNEYRPVGTLPVSPAWSSALLALTGSLGLRVQCGPNWLLVHDLS